LDKFILLLIREIKNSLLKFKSLPLKVHNYSIKPKFFNF
jgi:hypothetical protein